jgi:hypothetical protein
MKKIVYIISLLLVISSCSSAKKAEKSIETGDYDKAFNIAITKLNEDKYKKSNQKLIPMLKEAYTKANKRDQQKIENFKKLNNPVYLKDIYALYVAMDIRQDEVLMLQPLNYNNIEVTFETKNYKEDIDKSLLDYSSYLFNSGTKKLAGSKYDAREAFELFNDLEFVNPNYKNNIGDLIRQAKFKGSSLVLLKLNNKLHEQTTQEQLDELMRISESNMSNPWVIYHKQKKNNLNYDFEIKIDLEKLHISPEQVNTEIIPQQAKVKDGWEYVKDGNGNVMKDSLGNDIKRDRIITVQAEVKMFQQTKVSRIDGKIKILDLINNSLVSDTPTFGEAKFENIFALFQGDQRAIDPKYHKALQNKEVPFPPDPEFVKYALAEFRIKMLQLFDGQNF